MASSGSAATVQQALSSSWALQGQQQPPQQQPHYSTHTCIGPKFDDLPWQQ